VSTTCRPEYFAREASCRSVELLTPVTDSLPPTEDLKPFAKRRNQGLDLKPSLSYCSSSSHSGHGSMCRLSSSASAQQSRECQSMSLLYECHMIFISMSYHLRRFPWVAEMIPFALAPADPHWTGPDGAQHPAPEPSASPVGTCSSSPRAPLRRARRSPVRT